MFRLMMQSRVVASSSTSTLLKRSGHANPPLYRCKSSKKEEDNMATKLHEELSQVMEQRKVVRQRKGFLHFLKSNSSSMINVGATFFCVLLSYQIIALRRSGRVRHAELEETRKKLAQKQELLQSLTDDEFIRKMALECAESVDGPSWRWRRPPNSDLEATMQSILFKNLSQRIGDAGLSDEQKKERIISALRDAVKAADGETAEATMQSLLFKTLSQRIVDAGLSDEQNSERIVSALRDEANAADGETVEAIEIMEHPSGSTTVKKRVFSM